MDAQSVSIRVVPPSLRSLWGLEALFVFGNEGVDAKLETKILFV